MQGAGTQTLSGANTYSGATTVTGGIPYRSAQAASLAASQRPRSRGGHRGASISRSAGSQTIQGSRPASPGTRKVTLGANTLTAGTANSTSFAGTISGSGGLTKQGSGTLTLTGDNLYTGTTTVNAGTLAIGAGGSLSLSTAVNLAASGATFDISLGGSQFLQDLTGVGGSAVKLGANRLTLGFSDTQRPSSAWTSSGTGRLTKQGSGTLTLTGANTYSGGTTITAGTLVGNTTSLQGNILNDVLTPTFNQGERRHP